MSYLSATHLFLITIISSGGAFLKNKKKTKKKDEFPDLCV